MKRDDGAGHGSVVKHGLTTEMHAVRKGTIKESLTVHDKQLARADHFRGITKMVALGKRSISTAKDAPWS